MEAVVYEVYIENEKINVLAQSRSNLKLLPAGLGRPRHELN